MLELLKALLLGIIEGITEWLPVSSTGHLLLFNEFFPLNDPTPDGSFTMMLVEVIQLAAILAVVVYFFGRLNPFSKKKTKEERTATWILWSKILVAVIPGGLAVVIMKLLSQDIPDNPAIIALALIVYGIAFIVIERSKKNKVPKIDKAEEISYRTAFLIGVFQVLSIVPGTSRSGSTILGAMLLGVSRTAAADFTFFLAIPAMCGASGIEVLSYAKDVIENPALMFGTQELIILLFTMAVSFVVSLVCIKFLMGFVKRHSFESFGWYRIILGAILLAYFLIFA
ncbi:MAG: undecaprenyl-diphosphate phosphatase [Ruminococcaceae bacterium]|nr:undecaprenyl-diphosphate phosphatase [Oscillospiraceae bacterium]